jgi:hypothetical protein
MSEMSPELPMGDLYQRAVNHVYSSEPGQIMADHLEEWVRREISPDLMLWGVEQTTGARLSQVAQRTLGAWAAEETKKHHDQQLSGQGEIEWQQ